MVSKKRIPVFIGSHKEQAEYLQANKLSGQHLSLEESANVRGRIVPLLAMASGRAPEAVVGGRHLMPGGGEGWHYMWDMVHEKYEDDVPVQIVASPGERLVALFEDRELPAIALDQSVVSTAHITDADIYIASYPSVQWVYVRTHEPYGPYFVKSAIDSD